MFQGNSRQIKRIVTNILMETGIDKRVIVKNPFYYAL